LDWRRPARWLWTPVVAYMAMIFTFSSISQPPALPAGADKDVHALLYGGLGVLLVRAWAGGLRRRITLSAVTAATVIASLYGISDEFHQWFVPPRSVEAADVVADTVGAAAAAMALYLWSRWVARRGI
jgi:VanZ family protein